MTNPSPDEGLANPNLKNTTEDEFGRMRDGRGNIIDEYEAWRPRTQSKKDRQDG